MSRSTEGTSIILFCYTFILFILIATSTAIDTITANQTIKDDGSSTIVSADGVFELGFFSPGSSKNRYLGIWYRNISTGKVVWVANRQTPIIDNSGLLRIDTVKGILVLISGTNSIIWSSNSPTMPVVNNHVVAQLLDTGNFVIRYDYNTNTDPAAENFIWQSFDYPTDNILPGMKLGWDLEKGLEWYLLSWKSADDPSPGNYTQRISRDGYPQMLVLKSSDVLFRFGPWDGIQFSGVPYFRENKKINFVLDQKEISYAFVTRMEVNPNGNIGLLTMVDQNQSWITLSTAQRNDCNRYALCGAYGTCNNTKSQLEACECLEGYGPKSPERWKLADWSSGCVPKTQFDCGNGSDVFVQHSHLKLPDTTHSWFDLSMDLAECEKECLKNCSCTAYSNTDITQGGTGCLLWFDELLDIRYYSGYGLDLYLRTAASDLESNRSSRKKRQGSTSIIVISVLVLLTALLVLLLILVYWKRKLRRRGRLTFNPQSDVRNENEREGFDLPLFNFQVISNATSNFSQNNKLGEGGFGPVYKGIMDDGREIDVKRLSKGSKQGLDEFKNEVSCIAKLQHRNLVRLLGCCIEEGEMLLIYEYMPNKSLDSFIFDKELSKLLDWPKRYNIINGIVKGFLYLHQDSRLRIIHRDLKVSNILLDHEMNSKISDFGLARTFGGNESAVNTTRVVGTYGYMSPEYVIDGLFSVKSDVYSFGVVVLEIVSGKKIRGFYHTYHNLNLLGHAWKLFKEGKYLELTDSDIVKYCNHFEVFRAIQIGLLCVQLYLNDRPNMSFVVSMLTSENELPQPKEPGFFTERQHEINSSLSKHGSSLSTELTVTFFAPRY